MKLKSSFPGLKTSSDGTYRKYGKEIVERQNCYQIITRLVGRTEPNYSNLDKVFRFFRTDETRDN